MVYEKVKEVVGEQFGVKPEDLNLQSSLIDDLGADSLDIFEIIIAIEEEFNMEINDKDAEKFNTVGDIVGYIKTHS